MQKSLIKCFLREWASGFWPFLRSSEVGHSLLSLSEEKEEGMWRKRGLCGPGKEESEEL